MLQRTQQRRGTYAAIFGITASLMLGFTAIGVDVGWQRVAMTQLANGADAGAHAGALLLDGTAAGVVEARARALAVAQANEVHGANIVINQTDIRIGRYDAYLENDCTLSGGCWNLHGTAPQGYSVSMDPVGDEDANAVWVGAEKDVPTIFASFPFGQNTITAANYAIARLPIVAAPGVPCAFPMSMPQCTATNWMADQPCGKLIRLRRTSANQDNMAWSTPVGTTGAAAIREALATVDGTSCDNAYDSDDLGDSTDDTDLNNGNISSAMDILHAQLAGTSYTMSGDTYDYTGIPTGWDTTAWGACPTLSSSTCDPTSQGAQGNGNGPNSYVPACPDAGPACADSTAIFLKRSVTVFTDTGAGCDSDGNVNTNYAFNQDVATEGYLDIVIFDAGVTNDQYIDAFITCRNADGTDRADADVVHLGEDNIPTIDPPEEGSIAIVE